MSDNHEELSRLRERIDALDAQVLALLAERASLAQRIGAIKQGNIYRPEREAQVLRRVAELGGGPLPVEAVQRIFREIMSACLALEQPLTIAYLGPAGTFTEAAAHKHFGSAPSFEPCATIDDVFRAVESGRTDYGVVPVENSREGAVGRTLDLMLASPLQICGEVVLRIRQNLMSRAATCDGVRTVYSHAQSLAQCHAWLNRHLPAATRLPVSSNAEAARLAAQAAPEDGVAAIAGEGAAGLYGLGILAANIEDEPRNTTRFLVLATHDAGVSGFDKTSLVCSAQNRPGAVHDLLEPLKEYGVSMTRLESRPARGIEGSPWEYVFFIDVEGHRLDAPVAAALEAMRGRVSFLKLLGAYPRALA